MIKLKVPQSRAEILLDGVSHGRFKTGKFKNWRVSKDDKVGVQSILWLFCWAYNGDNSIEVARKVKQIFNEIFPFTFTSFNTRVGYKYSVRNRYSPRNLDYELQNKLGDLGKDLKNDKYIESKNVHIDTERKNETINALKKININSMENAIASAVTKLDEKGRSYSCEIKKINYLNKTQANISININLNFD